MTFHPSLLPASVSSIYRCVSSSLEGPGRPVSMPEKGTGTERFRDRLVTVHPTRLPLPFADKNPHTSRASP